MTFTIIARDPSSGDLGIAAQTRFFAVGRSVPWARPGIGGVATQALTEPALGPRVLDLLTSGLSAEEALEAVIAGDPRRQVRQLGVVDGTGRFAVHTGAQCIRHAEHVVKRDHATLGNIGTEPGIPQAMSSAFIESHGPLAWRMLAALQAGERTGGDLRGRQSASILIVSGDTLDPPWSSLVDLRVDDHPDPIGELARLLRLDEVFRRLSRGLDHLYSGMLEAAQTEFETAIEEADRVDPQVRFWDQLTRELAGESPPRDRNSLGPIWTELRRRLDETGALDLPSPPTGNHQDDPG